MKIPIFISVRVDSSRLPAKCLLEMDKGLTVLDFVVQRGLSFGLRPIVCTDNSSMEHGLENFFRKRAIEHFIGPKNNKLKRWYQAAKQLGIEKFHSVDADDPFFCAEQVRKSFSKASRGAIIFPSNYSDSGGATEGYTLFSNDISSADELSDDTDTSYIKPFIEHLTRIDCEDPEYAKKQTRLTLDYFEDYVYLRNLANHFDCTTPRSTVENFILVNNQFSNIQLNDVWKQRQIEEGKGALNAKI